jgi:hypothetical protein
MIHIEMPSQNPKSHIISFIPVIKELCTRVLKISTPSNLGTGWEDL